MINNGSSIPRHQVRTFKCPSCSDEVFTIVQGAVKFVFDALDPEKMQPMPVTLFECLGCHGYLVKHKTEGFKIVHKGGDSLKEGDEWKA